MKRRRFIETSVGAGFAGAAYALFTLTIQAPGSRQGQ